MDFSSVELFFKFWPWAYVFPALLALGIFFYCLSRSAARFRKLNAISWALFICGLVTSLYIVTFAKNHVGAKVAHDKWMQRTHK